jgi:hypothetical protein
VTTNIEHPTFDFHGAALEPWHANHGKRQVKAPQIYARNSGLLHAHALLLLGIHPAPSWIC